MSLTIRAIGPNFAGEVHGLDMRNKLSADEAAAIHAGMDKYAVLVFRDQKFDDAQQLACSRSLGEIEHAIGTSLRAAGDYRLPTTSPTFPTSQERHAVRATTAAACSASATGCGIPARSRPCRRSIRCCTPSASRQRVATRSSPICERPTMRWTRRPRPRSRAWSASIARCTRASRSASSISPTRNASASALSGSAWFAPIRSAAESRSTCRAMPAASSAGRNPRPLSSCAT